MIKNRGWLLIFLTVVFCFAFMSTALAATNISIYLDNQKLTCPVDPVVKDGRILVPVRLVSESIGATVNYYSTEKKIEIIQNGSTIILYVNKKDVYVNGVKSTLDVPATVINNYTLVPLRFVSENLNLLVAWDNAEKKVSLTKIKELTLTLLTEQELAFQNELLGYINQARTAIGLNEVILFDKLTTIARLHTKDMAINNFFSHTSPSFGDPQERARTQGMDNIAEVIAYGYPDAKSVFEAWMDSPTHREILLDADARFIGIGKYQKENGNDSIYAACDLFKGTGIIIANRQKKISGNTLPVDVFTLTSQPLIIYKLDPADTSRYLERQTINVAPDSDNWIHYDLELWDEGVFLVSFGQDILKIDNR